jgi:ribonuclease Z
MSMPLMQVLGDGAARAQRGGLARIFADVQDYHASPEQAADTARAAGVRALLLHHVAPPLPPLPGIEAAFMGDAPSRFAGPIRVALDGDLVTLPAGSTEVRFGRLP